MIRYMKADFHRIFGRLSRNIALLVLFAALGAFLYSVAEGSTPYELVETVTKMINIVGCPVFGLVEYGVVYSDDLKAKTMQIAIGSGISRRRVVLTKWLEIMLLTALDLIIFLGVAFVVSMLRGAVFSGEPLLDVLLLTAFSLLKLAGAAAVTGLLLFGTMNTGLSMVLFILSSTGILYFIVSGILTIGPLARLHLDSYLFTSLLEAAKSRAVIGTLSIRHLAGALCYLLIFYLLTCFLFRKVELEF